MKVCFFHRRRCTALEGCRRYCLVAPSALKLRHDPPPGHDEDPVADGPQLRQLARRHQPAAAAVDQRAEEPVDRPLCGGVDASRRLVAEQHPASRRELSAQHHLLLIAPSRAGRPVARSTCSRPPSASSGATAGTLSNPDKRTPLAEGYIPLAPEPRQARRSPPFNQASLPSVRASSIGLVSSELAIPPPRRSTTSGHSGASPSVFPEE